MRSKYTNVAIPEDLAHEVDDLVAKSTLGYTSRAQFVMEATRAKLKEEKALLNPSSKKGKN